MGHEGWVLALAVTPDGSQAISSSMDHTLKVWNTRTGEVEFSLHSHWGVVSDISLMSDGQKVVHASERELVVWNLVTREVEQTFQGIFSSMKLLPDNLHAVCGYHKEGSIKIINLVTGKVERTLIGHDKSTEALAVTHNGSHVISSSWDGTVKAWNLATGQTEWILTEGDFISHGVNTITVTPDNYFTILGLNDGKLKLCNLVTGEVEREYIGHNRPITSLVVTADGLRLLSASFDRTLRLWELKTGKELACIILDAGIRCTAIIPGMPLAIMFGDDSDNVYCMELVEPG